MQEADLIFGFDFYSFWAAGKVALAGGNIYDPALIHVAQLSAGWPSDWQTHKFPYPPWTVLFFIPFAILPFSIAKVIWAIFSLAILAHSSVIAADFLPEKTKLLTFKPIGLLIYLLLFPPLLRLILLGQTSFIPLYGIMLALRCLRREQILNSGMALSLTLIKPQQFLFFYGALISTSFLIRKNGGLLTGLILGLLAQLFLVSFIVPSPLGSYRDFLIYYLPEFSAYPVQTLPRYLQSYLNLGEIRSSFSLGVIGLGLIVGFLYRRDLKDLVIYVLPLSLLLSPYCWFHDSIILLLPYLRVVIAFRGAGVAMFLLTLYFSLQHRVELGAWLFPLVIMLSLYAQATKKPLFGGNPKRG